MMPLAIACTKSSPQKYQLYHDWLRRIEPALAWIDLETSDDPVAALDRADALLLPGGDDVEPARYGARDPKSLCNVDKLRDEREFRVIVHALKARLPILGVCRGMQIVNVALGGTLHLDLPLIGVGGHGKVDGRDTTHEITVERDSLLCEIVGEERGIVNSAHHQAVDRLAPALRICARSDDGVAEAAEWSDPRSDAFLLLVQWHPERMDDLASPFSQQVAAAFLAAARSARKDNSRRLQI